MRLASNEWESSQIDENKKEYLNNCYGLSEKECLKPLSLPTFNDTNLQFVPAKPQKILPIAANGAVHHLTSIQLNDEQHIEQFLNFGSPGHRYMKNMLRNNISNNQLGTNMVVKFFSNNNNGNFISNLSFLHLFSV